MAQKGSSRSRKGTHPYLNNNSTTPAKQSQLAGHAAWCWHHQHQQHQALKALLVLLLLPQEHIIHEAQTMKSYHHPNVLSLYTSFVHGQDLWMVTPFMSGGSVLHIMKYRFPKVCAMTAAAAAAAEAAGRVGWDPKQPTQRADRSPQQHAPLRAGT